MSQHSRNAWLTGGVSAALIASLVGVSSPALAADATVADAAALKTTVEALSAGASTITLDAGFAPIATSPTITIPAGVQLTLAGAESGTTVSKEAGATGWHFELRGNGSQTVTISGLTFEGFNPADPAGEPGGVPGGGLGINNVPTVTVSESTFAGIDGSSALALGGVSTLAVSDSSFLGNRAGSSAAIGLPSNITAVISDTTVRKNWGTQSGYSGGALRITGKSDVTVDRSVFDENVSLTRGGAIAFHQMDGKLTVRDSVFAGNTVPIQGNNNTLNDGGAIAVNERPITGPQTGQTVISGSTFSNNTAGDEGGALLLQSGNGSQATIENSTFFGNVAKGLQTSFDDTSGGGAIEAFGTPLTLTNNTFVNNFAERGKSLGHQRGGAVSATGDTAYLPVQPVTMSHNLFVGNDVGVTVGTPAPASSYRQVSARGGIETIVGIENLDFDPAAFHSLPVLTQDDLELIYPERLHNPADDNESDFVPIAGPAETNVGIDNGTAIDLSVINPLAVLGATAPALAGNGSGIVAGDARTGFAQSPGTILFHPSDDPYFIGLADGVGAAAAGITTDQRGFPVDDPADAGAVQQAFVRFDPNGGDWEDYAAAEFDGERIVQRADAALVWAIGAIGIESATEPAPSTAPAGTVFAGWNTAADGSGTAYAAGPITIPAGNLRLYAQWEDEIPQVIDGTVTVEYVDEAGNALRDPIVLTGHIGDPYAAEALEFPGYDLVRIEGVPAGDYAAEAATVRYHYEKQAGPPAGTSSVVAHYVDVDGTALREAITHRGSIGSSYQTQQLTFSGYSYLRVEGSATGVYEEAAATVTYVYQAKDPAGETPNPPVVQPPGAGVTPPGGGLALTGLDLGWPLVFGGASALLIATGVFLYGRTRANGERG